jgi:hypothetical protein
MDEVERVRIKKAGMHNQDIKDKLPFKNYLALLKEPPQSVIYTGRKELAWGGTFIVVL